MNIQPIAKNYNNYPKITFKSGYHNTQALQNISGIPCACCGRTVLNLDSIAKTFSKVTKPLSEVVEKGFIDEWVKDDKLWNILSNFIKKYPDKSLDTIVRSDKNFSNLRKFFSMTVKKEFPEKNYFEAEKFAKKLYKTLIFDTRSELVPAGMLIRRFKKYKQYLSDSPLKAFERLTFYSRKYPDKTLSEIVGMEEVYNYHKQRHEHILEDFQGEIDLHSDRIVKMIKTENPLAASSFAILKKRVYDILNKEKDFEGRKVLIKNLYTYFLDFFHCDATRDNVLKEVEQIPVKYSTEDAFFVTAHDLKWNDGNIMRNIFYSPCGTIDYIQAKAKGGVDNIYNAIVMCQDCNHKKDRKDIRTQLKYHPDMPKHMQKQMDIVIDGILSGKVTEDTLTRWPVLVSANLKFHTEAQISPDIGDFKEQAIELSIRKYHNNKAEIRRLEEKNDDLLAAKDDIKTEISKLYLLGATENYQQILALKSKIRDIYREMNRNISAIQEHEAWIHKNIKDIDFFERDDISEEIERFHINTVIKSSKVPE